MTKTFYMLAAALLIGCGDSTSETDSSGADGSEVGTLADAQALTGDAAEGEAIFSSNCAGCHGADGTNGSAPSIAGEDERNEIIEVVYQGEDEMPGFGDTLTSQEIADVAAYVIESL